MQTSQILSKAMVHSKEVWAFVVGAAIPVLIAIIGYIITVNSGIKLYTESYLLYPVSVLFSGTLGFYLGTLWSDRNVSTFFLTGFLVVSAICLILYNRKELITDLLFTVGFIIGLGLVFSGALDYKLDITKFMERILKRINWYIFGTGITAMFEIPLAQKIDTFQAKNITDLAYLIIIAVVFVTYLVLIHRYIEKQVK